MSSERYTRNLLFLIFTLLFYLTILTSFYVQASRHSSSSSSSIPSHIKDKLTFYYPTYSTIYDKKNDFLTVNSEQPHNSHHHWSIDEWWNNIQNEDRQRSAFQGRSLQLQNNDDDAHMRRERQDLDGDDLTVAESTDQGRVIVDDQSESGNIKHEGKSIFVDVPEHNSNRSALLKIKQFSGTSNDSKFFIYIYYK